jgi:DNA-binding NarL/FixJ family response regulator
LTKLRRTLEQEISERTSELARSANAHETGTEKGGAGGALGIDELLGRVMELKIAKKVLGEVTNLPTNATALADLTPREIEVLTLLAKGRSNHEIAHELSLALSTVKFHVGNILGKLHQTDRTQAALWAVRQGLVTPRQPESFSGLG